ncbi:MAG TPA: protein phosphatase 2C domain-containing protein [Roseiarcus sp.]|nr:protein phosphatase 2C domain-containing protein [Roseiarcus sp.]
MSEPLVFETAAATHVGKVRKVNEDSLLARPDIGLWAVADGMGGHGGGEAASGAVVAALDTIRSADTAAELMAQFEHRVIRANAELRALARSRNLGTIGTTLAALLIRPPHYACLWCGDSRAYLWRSGALSQVSHDHSEVQDLIDRGILDASEARTWPRRNVVTRAIGVAVEAELDLGEGRVAAGDRFLLCSDGLTNHVSDDEIAAALGDGAPKEACEDLLVLALQRGASDNVSLIVIACEHGEPPTVRSRWSWRSEAAPVERL